MKLKKVKSLELVPTAPFHFDSTFYKPGHFSSGDTKWEPGKRWQTMSWNGKKVGLVFSNTGSTKKPEICLEIFSEKKLPKKFLTSLKKENIWRYNLDLDLSEFYSEVGDDPLLKPSIQRLRGMRPMHHGSLYEYLIISIVLQNATVKRSVNMLQALFENYGTLLKYNKQKLWSFWEPERLAKAKEKRYWKRGREVRPS